MSNIKVQVRIRPPGTNPAMEYNKQQKQYYQIDYNDEVLTLVAPDRLQTEQVPTPQRFKFDRIYDPTATQEDVFDGICKPMLGEYFMGYNCCVMCYGQTGSGKSFTQTGGIQSYSQRGLMPRALESIFQRVQEDASRNYEVYISYIQILNEGGFDLLTKQQDPLEVQRQQLDALSRVTLQETSDSVIKVKNLSAYRAENLEAALNILWTGDLNRVVTATSQNQASSRSHCIFTVLLVQKQVNSDTVKKSKFHFVDLAGSERVSRTGADGVVLQQARYINVSLFHLETVIQALHRQMTQPQAHVPYRNSMMTLYLKDSLGGNCKTALLATIAVEVQNMTESVSTCQFAMQVGCIKNRASINEEVDVQVLIKRLKTENTLLKEELKLLKEGETANAQKALSDEDTEHIKQKVREFLADAELQQLQVGNYWRLQYAIRYMRELYVSKSGAPNEQKGAVPITESESQIQKLKELLQQRDAEIEILTQMVGGGVPGAPKKTQGPMYDYQYVDQEYNDQQPDAAAAQDVQFQREQSSSLSSTEQQQPAGWQRPLTAHRPPENAPPRPPKEDPETIERLRILSTAANICKVDLDTVTMEQLRDEQFIFNTFQQKYYKTGRLNEDKELLSGLYKDAKALADQVVASKKRADGLKRELLDLVANAGTETPESDAVKGQLQKQGEAYKEQIAGLKGLRGRIEALEADLTAGKEQMKKDFIRWYQYAVKYVSRRRPAGPRPADLGVDEELQREIDLFYRMKEGAGV